MAYTDDGRYRLPQTDLEAIADELDASIGSLQFLVEGLGLPLDRDAISASIKEMSAEIARLRAMVHRKDRRSKGRN